MRREWMALLVALVCGSAVCSEMVPPEWQKECVGRLQLALPGEADHGAYLFKDMFKDTAQYGQPQPRFLDGEDAGWSKFSMADITHPLTKAEKPIALKEFQGILNRARKYRKGNLVKLPAGKLVGQVWTVGNRDLGLDVIVNDVVFLWGQETNSDAEFALAKETLNSLITGLRSRSLFDVPSESGLCLPYVFIPDSGQEKHAIAMTYRLKEHPDITVNLKSETAASTPKPGDPIRRPEVVTNDYQSDQYWDNRTTASSGLYSAKTLWRFPAKRPMHLAGRPGLETFVAVVRRGATEEDYIYHAVARGNPDAPEAAPDIRFFVEQQRENAIKRGITPLTQDEVLKLARQIAASVGPRRGP